MSLKKLLLTGCVIFGAASSVHSQTSLRDAPTAPADLFSRPSAPSRKDAQALALRGIDPGPQVAAPLSLPAAHAPASSAATPAAPWQVVRPKPVAASATDEAKPGQIDLGALHYYAQQNDLARVSAEIRQIRSRHPDWQPPDDLFTDPVDAVDEQPLWDLYAKGDLQGIRDGIAALQRDKPEWQPSADLQSKIKEAETRTELARASDAGQWQAVVDLASDNGQLLTCSNVDLLWRTAEALVHLGDESRAVEAYDYVLANCRKPDERLATVQKASLLLKGPGALDGLVAQGRRGPDDRSEFEPVRMDLLRRKIGEAKPGGANPPSPQDLDALAADFDRTRAVADAEVLGWYNYGAKAYPSAESWFRKAIAISDAPKLAEGLGLSLREQGHLPEAEQLVLAHADSDPASRKLLIELVSASLFDRAAPTPSPDVMAGFLKAVEAAQSADGAQAYGWRLYNTGDVAGANNWFKKSNTWHPSEEAIVGLMVTAKRLKQTALYAGLVTQYATVYPKVAELANAMRSRGGSGTGDRGPRHLAASMSRRKGGAQGGSGWDGSADVIVKTFEGGNYDQAIAMLDARRQSKHEPNGLAIVRGWAQYHRGDWEGARKTFSTLNDTDLAREGREGLRVVQEGYTNPRYR